MPTVGEVFNLWLDLDMPNMSHWAFWALSHGHVTTDCPAEKLLEVERDEQAIQSMIANNLLDIGKIKIFVIETNTPDIYAFYFSENVLDAHRLHRQLFREKPKNITMSNRLLINRFEYEADFPTTGKLTTNLSEGWFMYELRRSVVEFPSYVGHARAGSCILQVGR